MNEYGVYFISWSENNVYFIRGFPFWNEYMISLVYLIWDVSMYSQIHFIVNILGT